MMPAGMLYVDTLAECREYDTFPFKSATLELSYNKYLTILTTIHNLRHLSSPCMIADGNLSFQVNISGTRVK